MILLGMLPLLGSANESVIREKNASNYLSSYSITLMDSMPKSTRQDDKDTKKTSAKDKSDPKKRPDPKKDPKTVDVDPKKPNIKAIPKARPKLRPRTVTDRVKIKRPPVKVKPGRGLRLGL